MDIEYHVIGRRIRNIRKHKGLTQEDLAKMSGMSVMSIRRYESAERIIPAEKLNNIANALEVSVYDLLPPMINAPEQLRNVLNEYGSRSYPNEFASILRDKIPNISDEMIERAERYVHKHNKYFENSRYLHMIDTLMSLPAKQQEAIFTLITALANRNPEE